LAIGKVSSLLGVGILRLLIHVYELTYKRRKFETMLCVSRTYATIALSPFFSEFGGIKFFDT
jgi:hypothetical protein